MASAISLPTSSLAAETEAICVISSLVETVFDNSCNDFTAAAVANSIP